MEASKDHSTTAPAQTQCQPQASKEGMIMSANESSPYVQYHDLEDYKMKGYGTHGHLPTVNPPRHAGATDAPTPSGSAVSTLRDR
jgi:Late embryogenesis abundant protein 18